MNLNTESEREENFFLVGMTIGGLIIGGFTFIMMRGLHRQYLRKLVSSVNLKTELINWIITDGVNLDRWEFEKEFNERAKFVIIAHNIQQEG